MVVTPEDNKIILEAVVGGLVSKQFGRARRHRNRTHRISKRVHRPLADVKGLKDRII
jgi:hypothetical protein